jgi:hypothetical protein
MANKSAADIYGSLSAPYINSTLVAGGAQFANSYGVTYPSQPNYLALFSGSTQGVVDNTCPQTFSTNSNLAQQLVNAGLSFAEYAEDLPLAGDTSCSSGAYTRRHNPVPDFSTLPPTENLPYADFSGALSNGTLPTISFVVPNLCNDMNGDVTHCAPTTDLVATGDQWLQTNVPVFLASTSAQNGLLIVTWDEDDGTASNNVPTIFYGPHVKVGYTSAAIINHYSVLRTLETIYGLPLLGNAATALLITDVWDDTIFKNGFEP